MIEYKNLLDKHSVLWNNLRKGGVFMAVLTKNTDIVVSNETEKKKALSVLNKTKQPSREVLDRLSKALEIDVKETFFTHGK